MFVKQIFIFYYFLREFSGPSGVDERAAGAGRIENTEGAGGRRLCRWWLFRAVAEVAWRRRVGRRGR